MPSPTVAGETASVAGTRSVGSGFPRPKGASRCELLREAQRQVARGDDGVDLHHFEEIVGVEVGVRVRGEVVCELLDPLLGDREAGGGPVTTEPLQIRGARPERPVEVERRRSSGPTPSTRPESV